MALTTHLLDKSAWEQARHAGAASRLAQQMRNRSLGICTVTAMGVLYSARNTTEYERDLARLRSMPWHDLADPQAAVELQRELASRGWHRTSIPDVIIAATAAEHELVVLHYDSDFERLAEVAGINHEWIIERGAGHAPGARAKGMS